MFWFIFFAFKIYNNNKLYFIQSLLLRVFFRGFIGRDLFNQNFRKFRSKTEWIGSVQTEKFRKSRSTFRGGPVCSVGPVRSKLPVPCYFPSVLAVCAVYALTFKGGLFPKRVSNVLSVIRKWCLKIFELNRQISSFSLVLVFYLAHIKVYSCVQILN